MILSYAISPTSKCRLSLIPHRVQVIASQMNREVSSEVSHISPGNSPHTMKDLFNIILDLYSITFNQVNRSDSRVASNAVPVHVRGSYH